MSIDGFECVLLFVDDANHVCSCLFFFFNDTATTESYTFLHTLSLHDALPILIFPYGAQQLRRPRERFLSLEGNVDWFDFWLNDHDEADPAKAEQYARWRRLRKQRDESRAESADRKSVV